MGRGLAKLLAQKGANVVIVARNKQKLEDALKYISVCGRLSLCLSLPNKLAVCGKRLSIPTISLHQRRRHEIGGERAHRQRSHCLE